MKLKFLANPLEFEQWRYNLLLVAPSKGEAKKTVSKGDIYFEGSTITKFGGATLTYLTGVATDDILSVRAELPIECFTDDLFQPSTSTVEALKAVEGTPVEGEPALWAYVLEGSPDYDENFGRKFWEEHVLDSICGPWETVAGYGHWHKLKISPDRLRKFSLLKPQGQPIFWEFGEWADRDIIRWSYGENLDGVYVPLD